MIDLKELGTDLHEYCENESNIFGYKYSMYFLVLNVPIALLLVFDPLIKKNMDQMYRAYFVSYFT